MFFKVLKVFFRGNWVRLLQALASCWSVCVASEAVAMFGRFCASQSGNVASSAKKEHF